MDSTTVICRWRTRSVLLGSAGVIRKELEAGWWKGCVLGLPNLPGHRRRRSNRKYVFGLVHLHCGCKHLGSRQ